MLNYKEDTYKNKSRINEISNLYEISILIDDEISAFSKEINSNIKLLQPDLTKGLVLKDFKKLKNLLRKK